MINPAPFHPSLVSLPATKTLFRGSQFSDPFAPGNWFISLQREVALLYAKPYLHSYTTTDVVDVVELMHSDTRDYQASYKPGGSSAYEGYVAPSWMPVPSNEDVPGSLFAAADGYPPKVLKDLEEHDRAGWIIPPGYYRAQPGFPLFHPEVMLVYPRNVLNFVSTTTPQDV
jgi:hypothetical protein